ATRRAAVRGDAGRRHVVRPSPRDGLQGDSHLERHGPEERSAMSWIALLLGAWGLYAWKQKQLPVGGAAPLTPLDRNPPATQLPPGFFDTLTPDVPTGTPVGEGGGPYAGMTQKMPLENTTVSGLIPGIDITSPIGTPFVDPRTGQSGIAY